MKKNAIIVTCSKGIPLFLSKEIRSLGLPVSIEDIAHVETAGTIDDAMRLNLHIRTGQRVLLLIKQFKADTPDILYYELTKIPWEEHLLEDGYFCVTSSVDNPSIRNTQFANVKCKDAIVDRIKNTKGIRPDSGSARDRAVVHLYWKGSKCAVFLDTSGEPLHMRGYRIIPYAAPMQETLSAAVVMATGWSGDENFINPMCGSGTLAIEALLIALNISPGLLRKNFGFMHLKGFNKTYWDKLVSEARRDIKKEISGKIIASDISRKALESAYKNAGFAGLEKFIEFKQCDFTETPLPEGGGVIVLNPEYGERLGDVEKLALVYKGIGDFFKHKCRGYKGYIFTGNMELAKKVGLRTKRKIPFFNSTIECRLLEYELYEGSRRKQNDVNRGCL